METLGGKVGFDPFKPVLAWSVVTPWEGMQTIHDEYYECRSHSRLLACLLTFYHVQQQIRTEFLGPRSRLLVLFTPAMLVQGAHLHLLHPAHHSFQEEVGVGVRKPAVALGLDPVAAAEDRILVAPGNRRLSGEGIVPGLAVGRCKD